MAFFAEKKAPSGRLFYYQILGGLALVLGLACWLNPNHYAPWVVFENEAMAFASILFAALALIVLNRRPALERAYTSRLFVTMLVVLVQFGFGMISWQSLGLGGLYLGAFVISISVGHCLHADSKTEDEALETKALVFVLLAAILSSGVVLGQWLRIGDYYPLLLSEHGSNRPFGNLGQPNNQATLLMTGIVCTELLLRKNALSLSVACISVLTLLPAIAATGSRTAVLSAVAIVVYLAVVARTKKVGFSVGWLLVLLALFVLLPKWGVAGNPDSSRLGELVTDSPRLHIYNQLLWAISDAPWTGYGWMQTAYAQSIAAAHVFGGVETDFAHNIVIDFLVWFGIPLGSMLLLSFCFTVTSNWRRSTIQYKQAYVVLVPFVVHSLLEFPFAYAFFLLPVGLVLGYLGTQAVAKNDAYSMPIRNRYAAFVSLFAVTTLLALTVCNDYLGLAEDFRVLRFENRNVGKVPPSFQPSAPLVLTDLRYMMEVIRFTPRPGKGSEEVERLREYVLRAHNPSAHVKLISQDILDGKFQNMTGEVQRFRNLYGEKIVNLGLSSLSSAYCDTSMLQQSTQQVCSNLSTNQNAVETRK